MSAAPSFVGNCRLSKQLSTLQLRDECHFTLWGRPVVQFHLLLVGQTPRLRAVPSRALRILLNYREAAAQPKAAPRQEGRPTMVAQQISGFEVSRKLSDLGLTNCAGARLPSQSTGIERPPRICSYRSRPNRGGLVRWSWKIGRLVGIDLYVHATFFLLILWVAIVYWVGGRSLAAVVNGVVFILVLFACVVAHEFGHALTARRYGIPTRDITLLPIGGISRLERMPDKPWEEFWVAVSGPAVNVALAIVLYAWILISHGWIPVTKLGIANGPFVERILMANLFLAVFNLLPAFPWMAAACFGPYSRRAWIIRELLGQRLVSARLSRLSLGCSDCFSIRFCYSSHSLSGSAPRRRQAPFR